MKKKSLSRILRLNGETFSLSDLSGMNFFGKRFHSGSSIGLNFKINGKRKTVWCRVKKAKEFVLSKDSSLRCTFSFSSQNSDKTFLFDSFSDNNTVHYSELE